MLLVALAVLLLFTSLFCEISHLTVVQYVCTYIITECFVIVVIVVVVVVVVVLRVLVTEGSPMCCLLSQAKNSLAFAGMVRDLPCTYVRMYAMCLQCVWGICTGLCI